MNLNNQTTTDALRSGFEAVFGSGAALQCAIAPGRVNLIGEHTDYNGGLVLPIAIDRHTAIVFRANDSNCFRLHAAAFANAPKAVEIHDSFGLSAKTIKPTQDKALFWTNYVRGMAASLLRRGIELVGGDFYIVSDLPMGAGLSSSAALEVAAGLAMLRLTNAKLNRQELALAAQEAEHKFAGVRCGIMDQSVVALAKAEHALMLDCRSLSVRHIPIRLNGWTFAVFDTGVRHELAGSEYNKRRAECEHAAKIMKGRTLRDVGLEQLLKCADKLTAGEHKRIRHVWSEDLRTTQFAAALGRGDIEQLGVLLGESHRSLARDYEVSCAELDFTVDALQQLGGANGCAGARMTGGGFGGSAVAIVKPECFATIAKRWKMSFKKRFKCEPGNALLINPGEAARVVALNT